MLSYVDVNNQALTQMQLIMSRYPLGFGKRLRALSFALSQPGAITIVGDLEPADT